jgi:hypothetical protein
MLRALSTVCGVFDRLGDDLLYDGGYCLYGAPCGNALASYACGGKCARTPYTAIYHGIRANGAMLGNRRGIHDLLCLDCLRCQRFFLSGGLDDLASGRHNVLLMLCR